MAKDDRSKGEGPPSKPHRRRGKPPVLELAATEIDRESQATEEHEAGSADQATSAANEANTSRRRLRPSGMVAAAGGAIVGALIAGLVLFLFERGGDPRLTKLASDVAALNARVEAIAGRPADATLATLGERMDRLGALLTETERRLAAVERRPAPQMPDLTPLAARTGAVEAALESLRKDMGERLRALEERVATLAAQGRAAVSPTLAAEIVTLGLLRDAMASGAPFKAELAAVRALLGERAASLATLEPTAATGLPTTATLARRFSELAPLLTREPAPQGGFLDRLMQSASHLVEVRRVGEEPTGDGLSAVVMRMDARLQRGDLAGALDEAAKAPALAASAAAEWLKVAKTRRDAEAALKSLIAASLASLASEPGRP